MVITTTYEKLFEAANAAQRWLNPADDTGKLDQTKATARKNTKLGYSITKSEPRIKKAHEAYSELIEENGIEHAEVDLTGEKTGIKGGLLMDSKGAFVYTKESLKARNAANRAVLQKHCEVDIHVATSLAGTEDITENDLELLTGVFIKEGTVAATAPE